MVSRSTQKDKDFGVQVKEVRTEHKKSRREVAERLGLSQQQLEKYENGDNRIAAGKLVEIAEALDVDFIELVPKNLLEVDNIDNLAIYLWKKLSITNKKAVINVMREMKN